MPMRRATRARRCGSREAERSRHLGTDGKAKVAIAGVPGQKLVVGDAAASKITTESLGTRSIEGVMAEGTRTTSTIPAGAIGNVMPIEVVTERWYSRELQMAVLISRRDPRSGDSVYRLRNIVKAEPPPDLFTVPSDYQVRGGQLGGFRVLKKLEDGEGRATARRSSERRDYRAVTSTRSDSALTFGCGLWLSTAVTA